MNCRFCNAKLNRIFVDLGMSPLANSYLNSKEINRMEPFYPLRTFVCGKCFLVQLEEFEKPEKIFTNYAYFSSYSSSWLEHVKDLAKDSILQFQLEKTNRIIEIASNDGYLLQYFKNQGMNVLGIEPAANVAKVAKEKGIPTVTKFFGVNTAKELKKQEKQADLLIAVNVLPHVPNLRDFVKGLQILLKPNGVLIIQFSAYLLDLMQKNEFDMIYHEHFSYFSLFTVQNILDSYGLEIFDIKELSVHGGSLRLFVKHKENDKWKKTTNIGNLLEKEKKFGLYKISTYANFSKQVQEVKKNVWKFFILAKKKNKKIACYGAPAKGNTLLNYCGIGSDFIDYTVDINPHKQGLFLPGTHIPIYAPKKIKESKPDYLVILPWNLKDEIMSQMNFIHNWGGKFVFLIPEVEIR